MWAKANGNPIEYVEHSRNTAEANFGRSTARFVKLEDQRLNLMVQGLWVSHRPVLASLRNVSYAKTIWLTSFLAPQGCTCM